jgi:Dyp-type peroxidase family
MTLYLLKHPGPLASGDPDAQSVLADLQGNILNGHGRRRAIHFFLRFASGRISDARRVLASLGKDHLTSAQKQLADSAAYKAGQTDAGRFMHLGLSAEGYRALGIPKLPGGSNPRQRSAGTGYRNVFADGMRSRQEALQDPEVSSWEAGFRGPVHAMVIVAANEAEDLATAEIQLRSLFGCDTAQPVATILTIERGLMLRRRFPNTDKDVSVEHFGYADGCSHPVLLDTQIERYDAESPERWNPVAPPRLVLVPDPNGEPGSCGSFLVFRKLEQNVLGFRNAVGQLASELDCPPALVGAMTVGRFEDGTPVVLQGSDNAVKHAANDFDYRDDPAGHRCPFQAHIRKTNPRLESAQLSILSFSPEEERGHRIARRGIPYGGERKTFDDSQDTLPERDVGLLFMCYQSDIWEQFEFQQSSWSNNDQFLLTGTDAAKLAPAYVHGTGLDALVGQRRPDERGAGAAASPRNWPARWDQVATRTIGSVAQFVTMKGGEYFFAPSLSSLKNLDH